MSQDELVPSERGLWTVEVYEDPDGRQPFTSWLKRLSEAVLLLGGYDKGRDPKEKKQEREIRRARKSLEDWRRQERAKKAR
jgi:hypothetical protein